MVRAFFLFLLLFSSPLPAEEKSSPETEFFQEESSPAQEKQTPFDSKKLLIKTVLLLAGLVGMLYGTAYFVKRMSGGRFTSSATEGEIRLVERKYISPKTSVWLLDIRGLSIVVVEGQNGVAVHSLTTQPTQKPLL